MWWGLLKSLKAAYSSLGGWNRERNAHWYNWQEIQGCWLASSHESGFPKLCNKLHHATLSGHWRVNWNSLVCCTWMKMPASSSMIIFISELFWTVLGWMGSRRDGGLLSTSLFFPGAALFPREGTCRSKPLHALAAASSPGRVPAYLSYLPRSGGHGLISKGERWVSLHAQLLFCVASWKQALNYAAQFCCVFFFFLFAHQIRNWNHQFISLKILFSTQISNSYLS